MNKYQKINTIFMRDETTKHKSLMLDKYSLPEFEYLSKLPWVWTEKIDGTNIRIQFNQDKKVVFKGKTDEAQIYSKLYEYMNDHFTLERMSPIFDGSLNVCLYGEGVGKGVQNKAERYTPTVGFILFDVWIDGWWLGRESLKDIASKLNIDLVPVVMTGSLGDAVQKCQDGFKSIYGDFIAEGLVGQPLVPLYTREGDRIITKLKYKDFNLYREELKKSTKVDRTHLVEKFGPIEGAPEGIIYGFDSPKPMEGGTDGG